MDLKYVGCATDAKFVEPTAVMLSSVEANGCIPEAVILVAAFDLSEDHKKYISVGAGALAERVKFIDVTREMFSHVKREFTAEYPPAVLGRLFLADYIHNPGARLLTLDSDMIVNGSLRPLFDLNLRGEFFAAVHDLPRKEDMNYFNSGMTLTDVDTYKHYNIGHRCLEWLIEHPHADLPDQDALNCTIGDCWYRLDGGWNRYLVKDRPIALEDYEGARIAHFAHRKPWDWSEHPGAPLYNRHLSKVRAKLDASEMIEKGNRDPLWRGFVTDREFAASCYEVILGRDPETEAVLEQWVGRRIGELVGIFLTSHEFRDNAIRSVRDGSSFWDNTYNGVPSLRQRYWAADRLPMTPAGRVSLTSSKSWRELIQNILSDSAVLATYGLSPNHLTGYDEEEIAASET